MSHTRLFRVICAALLSAGLFGCQPSGTPESTTTPEGTPTPVAAAPTYTDEQRLEFHKNLKNGHMKDAMAALEAHPDLVHSKGEYDWTVLHSASRHGDRELLEKFIAEGVDVNEVVPSGGWTPLHFTAQNGNAENAQVFIDHGVDINAQEKEENTALHQAAFEGHLAVVKVLVEAGAKTDIKNKYGRTAYKNAKFRKKDDIVKYLESKGITE